MLNLKDKLILAGDFETEGLNELYSRPWQLSFCIFKNKEEIFSYSSYIKIPNLNVSDGAARATQYNELKVEQEGKDPKEVFETFWKYLYNENYIPLFHNGLGYDVQINNVMRRELGYKPDSSYVDRMLDTNAIARGLKMKMLPKKGENFTAWQYKMLNIKAKGIRTSILALCKEFGIECDENKLHEALFDVRMSYKILQEIEKRLNH